MAILNDNGKEAALKDPVITKMIGLDMGLSDYVITSNGPIHVFSYKRSRISAVCDTEHDRDINATINIQHKGINDLNVSDHGGLRKSTPAVMKWEAPPFRAVSSHLLKERLKT